MSGVGLIIAAIVICVILSGVFSASEMSFSSCNQVRIEHLAENSKTPGRAKTVLRILKDFDSALSAILLGNNLVNIAASSLASIAAIHIAGESATIWATVILTIAVIIFGETIPKILAQKNATRFSLALSPFVRFLMLVLRPLTWITVGIVNLITKPLKGDPDADEEMAVEELHTIIETAEDEDVLDEDTSELMSAAIDFSEVSAQEVMTARMDLAAIDVEDSPEEIFALIDSCGHSRLPVYEDGIDNIIGILHVNHYLKAVTGGEKNVDIRSLLMPVGYVYKAMKLPAVLKQLQEQRQQAAMVTDEYGGIIGMVTVEDILEELVGEIWDETDVVEKEVTERADGSYEVDGDMLLADFAEIAGWREEELGFDSDTVGGWCIEMLGHFPEEKESFTYRQYEFTVLELGERRILRVLVRKTEETDG